MRLKAYYYVLCSITRPRGGGGGSGLCNWVNSDARAGALLLMRNLHSSSEQIYKDIQEDMTDHSYVVLN